MENEKKTATSNAEMVTISRAEYNELKLQKEYSFTLFNLPQVAVSFDAYAYSVTNEGAGLQPQTFGYKI